MAGSCPSPFLRSPYVFTFAHLYYLPHLHCSATYIATTQIRIFPPVQLSLSLSRKPIGPKHARRFRSNEPKPYSNGHYCYCRQRLPHQDRTPRCMQVSRFWDGCDMIFGEYHLERRGMGLIKGRGCRGSRWQRRAISDHCCFDMRDTLQWVSLWSKLLLLI
jgi:hypothetical protein